MQGFDDKSGEPKVPITMESWPSHQYLKKKKLPKDYFGRYACLDASVDRDSLACDRQEGSTATVAA